MTNEFLRLARKSHMVRLLCGNPSWINAPEKLGRSPVQLPI